MFALLILHCARHLYVYPPTFDFMQQQASPAGLTVLPLSFSGVKLDNLRVWRAVKLKPPSKSQSRSFQKLPKDLSFH